MDGLGNENRLCARIADPRSAPSAEGDGFVESAETLGMGAGHSSVGKGGRGQVRIDPGIGTTESGEVGFWFWAGLRVDEKEEDEAGGVMFVGERSGHVMEQRDVW